MKKNLNLRSSISLGLIFAFLLNSLGPVPTANAEPIYGVEGEFHLPAPGILVPLSQEFNPPVLKGIKVHPDNPFEFDFIMDTGDEYNRHSERRSSNRTLTVVREESQQEQLKIESTKLIKYFLASLTIPEQDLWVNLSPYEKDRIIPQSFGLTEMGRDLLAEDYMLKQITASLIYPEGDTGKRFWKRIYEQAAQKFGTTNIPVNTFNKVWIVPEKAVVYENAKAGTAYVVEAKLKVMLEQDYLSLSRHSERRSSNRTLTVVREESQQNINQLGSQIIREIVIPELTKEVNQDKNFAQLRQVYNSLILATWYKKKIKDSILEQVYTNKKKVTGVGYDKSVILTLNEVKGKDLKTSLDSSASAQNDTELIYQRYLQAFKKGVYNYIKEDLDPATQETTPRKYFSGGVDWAMFGTQADKALQFTTDEAMIHAPKDTFVVGMDIRPLDSAQLTELTRQRYRMKFGLHKASLLTSLTPEELQKIISNPGQFYVLKNGTTKLASIVRQWTTTDTSWSKINIRFDLLRKIKAMYSRRTLEHRNDPIVILDWGVGEAAAIIELNKILNQEGIPHKIYGLSHDYFPQWQNADEGITFILDDAKNLPQYLWPSSVDIIISNIGITHFVSQTSYRDHLGGIEKHLNDLGIILKPGGVLRIPVFSVEPRE